MDKAAIITVGLKINTNLEQNKFGLALAKASQESVGSTKVSKKK